MAKMEVKNTHYNFGLRQIAVVTIAAILFSKSQRAKCEDIQGSVSQSASSKIPCPEFCSLAPDTATRSKAPFKRWYYDTEEGLCKRFRWGGRGGNQNRFFKRADCEETCSKCSLNGDLTTKGSSRAESQDICSLPVEEGHCEQGHPDYSTTPQLLWHFDQIASKCSAFIFYGCGGNSNRFSSKEDCKATCL